MSSLEKWGLYFFTLFLSTIGCGQNGNRLVNRYLNPNCSYCAVHSYYWVIALLRATIKPEKMLNLASPVLPG